MAGLGDLFSGAKSWLGDDNNKMRLAGIGDVLMGLDQGRSVDVSPYLQAISQQKQAQAFKNSLGSDQIAGMFSPQERQFLATLPPQVAQGLIAERMFAKPEATKLETFTGPDGVVYQFDPRTGATKPLTGAKAANPGENVVTVNGQLVDKTTGRVIGDYRDPQAPNDPSSVREYEYYAKGARARGESPMPYEAYQAQMARAGSGAPSDVGSIPSGYQAVRDPVTNRILSLEPIPGGEAAQDAEAAAAKVAQQEALAGATGDTVVLSAKRALEAAQDRSLGAYGQGILSNLPWTQDAEVFRQVETLRSIAAAENINAMRQASPTGGALGNASDADIKLLKDKSGALDPRSPNFERDLMDYSRTLLRTIHGRETGDRIFAESFGGDGQGANPGQFSDATLNDLLNVDIMTLDGAGMDAWEARMKELKSDR